VEEAELIATSGARLSLKNVLILRALRDGKTFDEGWYSTALRQELLNLATEARADADRVVEERRRAIRREGRAQFQDDYRLIDGELLERREAVMRGLAERLLVLSDDEGYLARVIDEAREQALDEVAGAIRVPPAARSSAVSPAEDLERNLSLADLRDDLVELQRTSSRRLG
jgi:hypothetical protein